MCGILVIRDKNGVNVDKANSSLNMISHRGPDNTSYKLIKNNLYFGHVRLSILDVKDESSNQPYGVNDFIVFNGEIYNYKELSKKYLNFQEKDIKGDTQILFELLKKYDHNIIEEFNGDWSFTYYNQIKSQLIISRDRFGAKPLYVYSDNKIEIYSSEIKSIITYVDDIKYNEDVIKKFIKHGNPRYSPNTWYKNIVEFPPGGVLKINENNIEQYNIWSYENKSSRMNFVDSLNESINLRLRSDVGYSITLSAGIDSNFIFNKIREIEGDYPQAYNAAFPRKNMSKSNPLYSNIQLQSESEKIRSVYRGLNEKINYYNFNEISIIKQLKKAIYYIEEGHPSPAILPLLSLYSKIGKDNKVVIEGQGSDEVLLGYFSHVWPIAIIRSILQFRFMRAYSLWSTAKELYSFKASVKKILISFFPFSIRNDFNFPIWNGKLKVKKGLSLKSLSAKSFLKFHHINTLRGLLKYGDRLSMASSVESRNPFIDHEFVLSCLDLSFDDLFRANETKIPLREMSKNIVDSSIVNDVIKKGFPTPVDDWLENDFKEISLLLKNGNLVKFGFYSKNQIQKILNSYSRNKKKYTTLWRILSVEIWFIHYESRFKSPI